MHIIHLAGYIKLYISYYLVSTNNPGSKIESFKSINLTSLMHIFLKIFKVTFTIFNHLV